MKKQLILTGCIALLISALACQPQPPADTRAADETALRELDAQWSKAAASKDVDKTISYYGDEVTVLPANAPVATTREAIRKIWKDMLTSPGFAGGWQATRVEIARAGDMAYVSGTYELTMNDANGKPATDRGKFVEVWRKQTDGGWKCVMDIWNSDLPLPAPAAAEKK